MNNTMMQLLTPKRRAAGFSLIESVITITVILVLLAMTVYTYKLFAGKAKLSQIQSFLSEVSERQAAKFQDTRKYSDNLADLNLTLPPSFATTVQVFKLVVYTTSEGRSSYLGVAVPNYHFAQIANYYPLVVNPDSQYYSLTLACQGIRETDDNTYIAKSCGYNASVDVAWKKRIYRPILTAEMLRNNPPAPINSVTGDCAYAIALRDESLFNSFACAANYRWPYPTNSSPPISDACFDAFNSGDRTAFSGNACCSSNAWITKATGFCTDNGSAQPQGVDAYTSPESAGNIKQAGLCWAVNGGATVGSQVVNVTCDNVPAQKWYKGSDGKWRSVANPSLCLTAPTTAYTVLPATLEACNAGNRFQNIAVKSGTTSVYVDGFFCMSASGAGGFRLSSSGCGNNPSAIDIDSAYAANPVCESSTQSKDFITYKQAGCCSTLEWPYANINCASPLIKIGNTPATATNIAFQNGVCWTIAGPPYASGGGVSNTNCDQSNVNQKWYQTDDLLWHSKDNPDLCMQVDGGYSSTKATVQTCDPTNVRQKFIIKDGVVRQDNGFYCMASTKTGYYLTSATGSCTNSGSILKP